MEKIKESKNNKNRKNLWWIRLLVAVVFIAFTFIYQWLTKGVINRSGAIFFIVIVITGLLCFEFRKKLKHIIVPILSIVGEKTGTSGIEWRFFVKFGFILLFSIPFVFYLLSSGSKETSLSTLDFNIIIIAPTLGGLIFAGAGNKRIKNIARVELISVVKKFIVVTVLFIITRILIFTVDLTGGIQINTYDWSAMGIFRGFSFWISVVTFYVGVFLFLLGLVDLILTLRHLSK